MTNFKHYYKKNYKNIPYPSTLSPNDTLSNAGCGICCGSMIIENMTENKLSPEMLCKISLDKGYRVNKGTNMHGISQYISSKYKIHFKESNNSEDLLSCLNNGGIAIVNVGKKNHNGLFSNCGHYIIVYSKDNEYLYISDPDFNESRYISNNQVKIVSSSILVTLDCLVDEIFNNKNPFLLFNNN